MNLEDRAYTKPEVEAMVVKEVSEALKREPMKHFGPFDSRYFPKVKELVPYVSLGAEIRYCVRVHAALMKGLHHFGLASEQNVSELEAAVDKIDPFEVQETEDNVTKHDQLAIIKVASKHVSEDTAKKMHPGTTSYDILDTARALMYKDTILNVILPQTKRYLAALVALAEQYVERVQIGRTHGQWTSPVTFGYVIAGYAARVAERAVKLEEAAKSLEGKIAGIVGTGASIATFVGKENVKEFQRYVLEDCLKVKVATAPTQIVPKERTTDLIHYLLTLDGVLADLSNSMRHLQRSEINEVSQSDTLERLGGSSADPSKNNPIDFENVNGLWEVLIPAMQNVYHLQVSDHQRDLRSSVQARFIPEIFCGVYESLTRLTKVMKGLAVIESSMDAHLDAAQKRSNAEAMNAILKHHGFPNAHERVKGWSKKAVKTNGELLRIAMEDDEFRHAWDHFSEQEREYILNIRKYVGEAVEETHMVIDTIKPLL